MQVLKEFCCLSGFKINWTKSALLPLSDPATGLQFPAGIPIIQDFKCLVIQIFISLNRIVTHNYSETLNKIKADLDRWITLPNSLRDRVSIVKMNILPRIHFISSMIPLSPRVNYWNKIHSVCLDLFGTESVCTSNCPPHKEEWPMVAYLYQTLSFISGHSYSGHYLCGVIQMS